MLNLMAILFYIFYIFCFFLQVLRLYTIFQVMANFKFLYVYALAWLFAI